MHCKGWWRRPLCGLQDMRNCRDFNFNNEICKYLLPIPIDKHTHFWGSIPEASLLTTRSLLQNLYLLYWLQFSTICPEHHVGSSPSYCQVHPETVHVNYILQLQPDYTAFVGSTMIRFKPLVEVFKNVTYRIHRIEVSFRCFEHLPSKIELPDQKTSKISSTSQAWTSLRTI